MLEGTADMSLLQRPARRLLKPGQARKRHGADRRAQLDRAAQHVTGDTAEPVHAMRRQGRAGRHRYQNRYRSLPRPGTGRHRNGEQDGEPGRHHRRGLRTGDPRAQGAAVGCRHQPATDQYGGDPAG